ncbi:MAG: S-formylglutathione hydrolase [Rickettsiales bacterium]|nr:S-formylglutathione hydrolase [Rickettsiales bacterium]
MKENATHLCHSGKIIYCEHEAATTNCTMTFTIFLPPQAEKSPCPALFYLAGLTCTEENFTTKANAYKMAAELGLILIAPDTSPRGDDVADAEGYDIGKGAGFYINATQEPWAAHYQMEDYIAKELYQLVLAEFPIAKNKIGIFGHSMGGHGALTLHLKYPELFKSVSAFAPICAPTQCPWGEKVFSAYLGDDRTNWSAHDASELMLQSDIATDQRAPIVIDQGLADSFLSHQLFPDTFEQACKQVGHPLSLQKHEGYDHGYFFIQSFMDKHLTHHHTQLTT